MTLHRVGRSESPVPLWVEGWTPSPPRSNGQSPGCQGLQTNQIEGREMKQIEKPGRCLGLIKRALTLQGVQNCSLWELDTSVPKLSFVKLATSLWQVRLNPRLLSSQLLQVCLDQTHSELNKLASLFGDVKKFLWPGTSSHHSCFDKSRMAHISDAARGTEDMCQYTRNCLFDDTVLILAAVCLLCFTISFIHGLFLRGPKTPHQFFL